MSATYILRLDDSHPKQLDVNWSRIERILDELQIKPIVAIIPDNTDKSIVYDDIGDELFWAKVRKWQAKGWAIGLHGLHHDLRFYKNSILPYSKNTEFSGVEFELQTSMINSSIQIFKNNGCTVDYFVAPAHGYDKETLNTLKLLTPPLVISDGFGFRPYIKGGLKFVPQQLWKGRRMPFGVWTICLHPNNMSNLEFEKFEYFAKNNSKKFRSPLFDLKFNKLNLIDIFFFATHRLIFAVNTFLRKGL